MEFALFIIGCICGVIGYFLIKSGVAADPNEVGKIVTGIVLEVVCLFFAGWALVEFSD